MTSSSPITLLRRLRGCCLSRKAYGPNSTPLKTSRPPPCRCGNRPDFLRKSNEARAAGEEEQSGQVLIQGGRGIDHACEQLVEIRCPPTRRPVAVGPCEPCASP